jgi:hypothetical protein
MSVAGSLGEESTGPPAADKETLRPYARLAASVYDRALAGRTGEGAASQARLPAQAGGSA